MARRYTVPEITDQAPRIFPETKPLTLEPMWDFEQRWSGRLGAKESAIRAEFGVSAARYYQVLDRLMDTREALQHDPVTTNRLIRLRDTRAAARANRRFTPQHR